MLATDADRRGPAGLAERFSAAMPRSTARSMPSHRSTGLAPAFSRLDATLDQRVGQHDGGGGAVAGDLVGLHRHFAQRPARPCSRTVIQLDLGGDADTVAGDHRRADRPVDHGVHALGAERRLDGRGELGDAAAQRCPARLHREA